MIGKLKLEKKNKLSALTMTIGPGLHYYIIDKHLRILILAKKYRLFCRNTFFQ